MGERINSKLVEWDSIMVILMMVFRMVYGVVELFGILVGKLA